MPVLRATPEVKEINSSLILLLAVVEVSAARSPAHSQVNWISLHRKSFTGTEISPQVTAEQQ